MWAPVPAPVSGVPAATRAAEQAADMAEFDELMDGPAYDELVKNA